MCLFVRPIEARIGEHRETRFKEVFRANQDRGLW